jgi:molybdenum cofactor sulfurase
LDAAAFIPTNRLDLSKVKPDFVTMSFYKIFGYPTGMFFRVELQSGLGALLIRNSNIDILNKLYWGGGTVSIASDKDHFCLFHVEKE